MLLFEEKVKSKAFINKVIDISQKLGINPNWLMAVMNSETGGTFDPSISNIGCVKNRDFTQCAVGLIQFMPATAKGLGTSIAELKKMSAVQQLDYVYKYFLPFRNKITNYHDLYLVTFYPYALGKGDDYIFGSEKSDAWAKKIKEQNPYDYDKDGYISMSDYKQFIYRKIPEQFRAELQKGLDTAILVEKYMKRNWLPITLTLVGIGFGLLLLVRAHNSREIALST